MNSIVRLVQRALHRIARLVARTARFVRAITATATARTVEFARSSRSRLTARWHTDSSYRRTLIAAVAAITATLLPHPAVAAAIGALIAERPTRSTARHDPFLDEFDEDDYPPRRAPADPWASPRRLWDSLD
jgi:hypothetical protein